MDFISYLNYTTFAAKCQIKICCSENGASREYTSLGPTDLERVHVSDKETLCQMKSRLTVAEASALPTDFG